jgi:hypothetical protein
MGEEEDMPKSTRCAATRLVCGLAIAAFLSGVTVFAAVAPQGDPVASRATAHPDLFVATVHLPLDQLPSSLATTLRASLSGISVNPDLAAFDLRAGRFGSLVAKTPLVPGSGVDNTLTWAKLGRLAPMSDAAYRDAVWQAFKTFLLVNQGVLGVNSAELGAPNVSAYENNRLVHLYAPRVYGGVPVRDSFVKAALNSGNLVLYATRNWGTIDISTAPAVSADAARGVVSAHLSGFAVSEWGTPQLAIVPLLAGANPETAVGHGYAYRLAWSIGAAVSGSAGSWEALVDAKSGELLAFHDRNSYIDQKKVVGGVFPVSNDGLSPGGIPDGIEQPGYPMSRATVIQGTTQLTANSEGLVNATGEYRTTLTGPFVRIQDGCGAVDERTTCDALDLGTGAGRDCMRPSGYSFGDTRSARTGFYELNRIIDQAKSWVGPTASNNQPTVGWLNMQFPAKMNIENACNAFFSPADTTAPTTGSINFYRQGNLGSNFCRNTGEIPAVFDHEWGHGLDTFDNAKGVSLPGEFYADAASIVRLNQSCIARGFFFDNTTAGFCPGNGDVCTECSGVREVDWMKRLSQMPHDLAWVLDQNPTIPGSCGARIVPPTPFNAGPCGFNTHCEGTIIGESFWDLLKRDLPCHGKGWESVAGGSVAGGRCKGADPNPTIDDRTALVLGTRLFYIAGPGVVTGYQCDVRIGGCNADSWYFNLLAADDDDGAIENGTPHMLALSDAFRRHGIACRAPVAMNFGCVATPAPAAAPAVTAVAGVRSATITWAAVPNALEYWVLRTNGVHGCETGKTRIARVSATASRTFTQTDLLDGLTYFYSVVPVGGLAATGTVADACSGPMSDCAAVTPLPPAEEPSSCVPPPNRPPDAVNDALTAPTNHPHKLNLLANDTDPDNDLFHVASVISPANGQATVDADGSVTYTPVAGFTGPDSFQYVLSDGRGGTDTATVALTVAGDPCAEGFTVLTDPAGDALSEQPEHDVRSAAVAQTADGKFVFILKMAGMTAPPPDTTWPITFAVDGDFPSYRFVKMAFGTQTCLPVSTSNPAGGVSTAPCFAYGTGDPGVAGTPAPGSSFSADGTIRIVVPASGLGNPQPGRQLKAFLTRIRLDGGAVLLFPDNMPDSAAPAGTYTVTTCGGTAAGAGP